MRNHLDNAQRFSLADCVWEKEINWLIYNSFHTQHLKHYGNYSQINLQMFIYTRLQSNTHTHTHFSLSLLLNPNLKFGLSAFVDAKTETIQSLYEAVFLVDPKYICLDVFQLCSKGQKHFLQKTCLTSRSHLSVINHYGLISHIC